MKMNPSKADSSMTTRSKGTQATSRAGTPDHEDMPPTKRVRRNSNPESLTPPVKGHHRTRSTASNSRSSTPTPPVGKEGKQPNTPVTVASKAKVEGKLTPSSGKKRSLSSMLESGTAPNVPAPRFRKIGQNDGTGVNNQNDYFCWICHRDGTVIVCEVCPRVFHPKCLGLENNQPEDWVCPECEKIMRAECVDTQSKSMSMISLEQLCMLLKFSLERMQHPTSDPFLKPVDLYAIHHYKDYIFNPMDLGQLEKNIESKMYGCTEAFLADSKWILHNCIIYNGTHHKLTSSAKLIVKICKHETSEIEICPDCYMNSCLQRNDNWFCEPCRTPHTLVWAKLKGYPFWPAKALREVDGQVDVRFFGAHDRSWVPVSQVFLLSKDIPTAFRNKKANGFEQAMEEIQLHIDKIREEFGTFEYAVFRTPYDVNNVYFHNKMKVTTAAAMMKMSKMKAAKSVKNNHGLTKSGNNSPKPSAQKNSMDGKQPEKSMATKTASAVKIKYNSIITTRRAAAAKMASSGSLATEPDAPPAQEIVPQTGSSPAVPLEKSKEPETSQSDKTPVGQTLPVKNQTVSENMETDKNLTESSSERTLSNQSKVSSQTPQLIVKTEPFSPEVKVQTKSEIAVTNIPPQTISNNLEKSPVLSRAKLLVTSPTAKLISSSVKLTVTSPSAISKLVSSRSELTVTSSSSITNPVSSASQCAMPIGSTKTSVLSGVFTLSDKVIKPLANKLMLSRTTKPVVQKPILPNCDAVNKLEFTLQRMKNDETDNGDELESDRLKHAETASSKMDKTLLTTNCDTEKEKSEENPISSQTAKNTVGKNIVNSVPYDNVRELDDKKLVIGNDTKPGEIQGQTTVGQGQTNEIQGQTTEVEGQSTEIQEQTMVDQLGLTTANSKEHSLEPPQVSADTQVGNPNKNLEISPGKASYLEKLQKTIESCKAKLGLEGEAEDEPLSDDDASESEDSDDSDQDAPDNYDDKGDDPAPTDIESKSAENTEDTHTVESSDSGGVTQNTELPKEGSQTGGTEAQHESKDKDVDISASELSEEVKNKRESTPTDQSLTHNSANSKVNSSANTGGAEKMEVDNSKSSSLPDEGKALTIEKKSAAAPTVKKVVSSSDVLHRKCVDQSSKQSEATPMEVDTDTDSNNLVIDLDDPIISPVKGTSEKKIVRKVETPETDLSKGNSAASSNERTSNLKTMLTSPEDRVITTITPVYSASISKSLCTPTQVSQVYSTAQAAKTVTLTSTASGVVKAQPVILNAPKPAIVASVNKQQALVFPTSLAQKVVPITSSKFVPIASKSRPLLPQPSPVILKPAGSAKSPPSAPLKVSLPGPPPLQLSPQVAAASVSTVKKTMSHAATTTTAQAPITFKVGPASSIHGTVTLPIQSVTVSPPMMSKFNLAKLSPINVNKYMTQILSTVKNSVDEMYADLTNEDRFQTAMKHFQLELEKVEWMHKREIAEIKHNLEISVSEIKKGYDAKLSTVTKALQTKHEEDKQSAMAEVKKKQWCANCGKEAIFYCCWNTSYCDYPCQTNHWPSHMDNCTQSQGFQKPSPINQSNTSDVQITQVAKAVSLQQTPTQSPTDENAQMSSRLESQQRLNWKERMATIQQLEEKEMGRRSLMNATANGIPHLVNSQHQMMPSTSPHNHFTGPVVNPAQRPMMATPGGPAMMGQMMTPAVGLTEQMLRGGNSNQLASMPGQMIRGGSTQMVNPQGQSIRGNLGQISNSSGQIVQTSTGGSILQAGPPLQLQYIPGSSPHPPGTIPHPPGAMPHPPGAMPHPPGTMPHPPGTMPHPPGTMPHPPGTIPQPQGTMAHSLPPAPQLRGYHQSVHQIRFPVSTQQGFSVLQQQQSMAAQNNSMMYPIVNQQGQGHVIQHGPIMFPQNQQRSNTNIDSKNSFKVHNRQY